MNICETFKFINTKEKPQVSGDALSITFLLHKSGKLYILIQ